MKFFIGAYATSPCLATWNINAETAYYEGIKQIPFVRGLEHPFWGTLHKFDEDWFLRSIDKLWDYIFTCIPGTMEEMKKNENFGLASDDIEGRLSAVAYTERAYRAIKKLNEFLGRNAVLAVELHSAPNRSIKGVSSSKNSFINSLIEINSWDWGKTRLIVEHCDAWKSGLVPEKGFLLIEDEIDAIKKINLDEKVRKINMLINWGRSAIEGRSVNEVIKHIQIAKEHDLLNGLIFSGCSDQNSLYGKWKDMHVPPAKALDNRYYEEESLMNYDNMKEALHESNFKKLDFIGIKLLDAAPHSTIERRIGLNRDTIRIIKNITDKY